MDLLNPRIATSTIYERAFRFAAPIGVTVLVVGLCAVVTSRFVRLSSTQIARLPRSGPRTEFFALDEPRTFPVGRPRLPIAKDSAALATPLTAEAVVAVDDESNTVLYKKNAQTPRSLASITKLMSMLVFIDIAPAWESSMTVLASDIDNTSHHLKSGDRLTLEQLWNIALVGSDNAAVRILVRSTRMSEKEFVARMNKKAQTLGFLSAQFSDPTGLDSKNIASALDVARLLKEALGVKKISATLEQGEYDIGTTRKDKRRIFSTNWLLTDWVPNSFGPGSIVGKTGYIQDSGYNFAVRLSEKDGHTIRVVVLGATSNQARFSEARDVGLYVFNHFSWPGDAGYDTLHNGVLAASSAHKTTRLYEN